MGTPEGWGTRTIEEVAEVIGGGTPRRDRPDFWTGGIPWATPTDITGNRGRYLRSTSSEISPAGLSESAAQLLPAGTILLTSRATIGASAIATFPVATNQGFQNLVPRKGLDTEFLYYAAQNVVPELVRRAAGSTFLEVSRGAVRTTSLLVPPLGEQRKIAAILSSVDETIEKTEAVIEQLQVVKKAMMQELLTRGMPGRHTRFKQTEIGEIPESWEVANLGSLVREPIRNGYSPQSPNEPTGRWTLGLGAVGFEGFEPNARKPAPLDDPRVDASTLEAGDLLLSRSNTRERVGLVGIYRGEPHPCSYPDLLMRIRCNERVAPEFLEATLLSNHGRLYFETRARGTSGSMVKVNRAIVEGFPVPLPSATEQREIVEILHSTSSRIDAERKGMSHARDLKNALGSALLAGDVRVTPDEAAP